MAVGETYEEFVEKFKPKKTTDDCYTPRNVYAAIRDWVCKEYGVNPKCIVRPFYPCGDYERFVYRKGAVVVDNPPFSIVSRICAFFDDRSIPFFLFVPHLTAMNVFAKCKSVQVVGCGANIKYANGATVNTSFATNLDRRYIVRTAPDLLRSIDEAVKKTDKKEAKPSYSYPDEVLTMHMLKRIARNGIDFTIPSGAGEFVRDLDEQRGKGKNIYGGGLLIGTRDAERKAECLAKRNDSIKQIKQIEWKLSPREREIVRKLDGENQ